MRKLNNRQKKYLDILYEQGVRDVEDMTGQQWQALERMNDHETLWQNANRYLWDRLWENNYG